MTNEAERGEKYFQDTSLNQWRLKNTLFVKNFFYFLTNLDLNYHKGL